MEEQELYEGQKRLEEGFCPMCDYPLELEYGCSVCYNCGWFEGCDEEEED